MKNPLKKKRLDEILYDEGLITNVEIREALAGQRDYGGKLGTHLIHLGHISESDLVRALSIRYNCPRVVLSKVKIHEIIIKMIPQKVAMARLAIPFDYNPEDNLLKIACLKPTDANLIRELQFVAHGKKIKLYLAAEYSIIIAINNYYLNRKISIADVVTLNLAETITDDDSVTNYQGKKESISESEKAIIVSECFESANLLRELLEQDNYFVTIADSADKAIDIIAHQKYAALFIKDSTPGDCIDLIDRVRKISPATIVRYYNSASNLVLEPDSDSLNANLLRANLDIMTSLLSSLSHQFSNHSGRVGAYANKLCQWMKLPAKDCLLISTAGYIHDLAGYYYRTKNASENPNTISLTIKLLSSLGYYPIILEILRSSHININGKFTHHLPIEILGGNIVTIADLFADSIPQDGQLSLDKFDKIASKFREKTGELFLPEVSESFIEMMQEEILTLDKKNRTSQIMVYSEDPIAYKPIEMRLKHEGFRTLIVNSIDTFASLYRRGQPDVVILVMHGRPDQIALQTANLYKHDINLKLIPAFIITDPDAVNHLTMLLEQGIEDIVSLEDNLDLLVAKIYRLNENRSNKVQSIKVEKAIQEQTQ